MSYSAIVPMYNEGSRVSNVLRSLQKCNDITEIICVDDGSTDSSYETVKADFDEVILVKHTANKGKLQAVRTGLGFCSNENIVLMDSDLINIIPEEIDKAIKVYENNEIDCLLLCTKPMNKLDELARCIFRLPHIATGCRIINKKLLNASITNSGNLSYQLEPAQNKYLMDNKKSVAYVNISAVGILKSKKVGFLRGTLKEFVMWYEFLSFGGIIFNVKQVLLFARKKYDL